MRTQFVSTHYMYLQTEALRCGIYMYVTERVVQLLTCDNIVMIILPRGLFTPRMGDKLLIKEVLAFANVKSAN